MSRSGKTPPLDWADGTYEFALAWGELAELQDICNAGPFVVVARLASNQWRIEDVSGVIRLGLIGGGAEPAKALKLVQTYVEARPQDLVLNASFARGILETAIMGAPDEPPGEPEAARETVSD
ncbi:Phage tail tube protein, GTA-gp10 [Devosia crocina]|uniref:Phage tail tube protein, GTA-gp10 n=1 Tax=Devosia crocina TaxID=429728 RepID=A0A1I7NEU8_9HYPH|nr:gene transfer agent family protein [Devosia crocina]SFV33170.1 Phage tail tube protein, GTA-gp10 [Devosia crocina]